ncbi:MAG: 50S ribosomal protein L35ae [Nanoarchaeota archaeon]
MEPIVVNFRLGRHHKKDKQMVIKVADSADAAAKMIGKTAVWTSSAGKELKGKITQLHGRNGNVRVHFSEKGLPGQALGQKVKVA